MERDDVITFFHEYGHLIHGIMKGNTTWAEGDLENDFIEALPRCLKNGRRILPSCRLSRATTRRMSPSRWNWRRSQGCR